MKSVASVGCQPAAAKMSALSAMSRLASWIDSGGALHGERSDISCPLHGGRPGRFESLGLFEGPLVLLVLLGQTRVLMTTGVIDQQITLPAHGKFQRTSGDVRRNTSLELGTKRIGIRHTGQFRQEFLVCGLFDDAHRTFPKPSPCLRNLGSTRSRQSAWPAGHRLWKYRRNLGRQLHARSAEAMVHSSSALFGKTVLLDIGLGRARILVLGMRPGIAPILERGVVALDLIGHVLLGEFLLEGELFPGESQLLLGDLVGLERSPRDCPEAAGRRAPAALCPDSSQTRNQSPNLEHLPP